MFKTELEYLRQILFDENSEVIEDLRPLISEIGMIGYRYENKEGKLYMNDADGSEIQSINDTKGNYAYIRYTDDDGGHIYSEKTTKVRLTLVACLPKIGIDSVKVGVKLMNFLSESSESGGKIGKLSKLNSNRMNIWNKETNFPKERYRADLSIISFDFDLFFVNPNDCDL